MPKGKRRCYLLSIVILVMAVVGMIVSVILVRRECRKTEAMRQAACILMGLPQNTSMKELRRMYKEMNKHEKAPAIE